MKRLDGYLLKELAGPFLFGVTAFASIMVGSNLLLQLANYLIEMNMPIHLASKIFFLELPGIIVLTFPMSTLLATLLTFGRLSGNSEIIAFKAGGVSFFRMMVPIIIVGILISFLTIYVNERVVPLTTYETRRMVYEFTNKKKLPSTQKYLSLNPIDQKSGLPDYILYAEGFNGDSRTLSGVYFQDFQGERLVSIVEAKEARWVGYRWIFYDGKSYYFPAEEQPVLIGKFDQFEMKALNRTPQQIALASKTAEEMTVNQLREMIQIYQKDGRDTNKILVKFYQRFTIPLSCLIFALVGAPLGLQPNRSGSSIGLGLSIIVIFIYYVTLTVGGTLGQAGVIPPVFGAWLPNLIFGLAGIGLIYRAATR